MKFIETKYFKEQIFILEKNFNKINSDFGEFKDKFELSFGIHLGEGVYKFRCRNSSIPVGKSGGFRIIAKIVGEKVLPIMIYSKTHKSNVSKLEILEALRKTLDEI